MPRRPPRAKPQRRERSSPRLRQRSVLQESKQRPQLRYLGAALAAAILLLLLANTTQAAETSTLSVSLHPKRLGAATTILFAIKLKGTADQLPSPLRSIELQYPASIGIVPSGLGLSTCTAKRIEDYGPEACPPDSLMGKGNATAGLSFGPLNLTETGNITIWMAPEHEGHTTLLFNAEAVSPILDDIVIESQLLPAPPPYGGKLQINVPAIPTLPGAPNGSILEMHATLGPKGITYYEFNKGHRLAYHPVGLLLPHHCHGGFPFAATFGYEDGTTSTSRQTVPCPR